LSDTVKKEYGIGGEDRMHRERESGDKTLFGTL
jgi:hypothetical protein